MKFLLWAFLQLSILLGGFSAYADSNENSFPTTNTIHSDRVADAASSGIPYKEETDPYFSIIGSFVFVIGILLAGFFLLSKHKTKLSKLGFLPVDQGKHLVVLDRQKLHADNVVYLVLVDGKKYLLVVGRTGTSISAIVT